MKQNKIQKNAPALYASLMKSGLIPSDSDQRLVRQGWRGFECQECGHRWEWATRDYLSPSGECCPHCGENEFPRSHRADTTIPTDEMGNITIRYDSQPNVKDHTS